MAKKTRKKIFLIVAVLTLGVLIATIIFLPPTYAIDLSLFTIPLFIIDFLLLFLFLYSLTAFLFKSFIHGILVGLFPVVYLIMRLNELTGPLFFVLLLGIFVTLEILLVQMTRNKSI